MNPILQIQDVQKIFGKGANQFTALRDINFTIQQGEMVGIMGPSGAGKSTLLNILATIDTPTNGKIFMNNQKLHELKEKQLADFRRENLGFIFQDYNLLDSLTVRENILLPLAISKVPAAEIRKRVDEIARLFGIETLFEKYPYQISGGQKQRTAAARALITQPALILADEPTGALDSKSAIDLLESLSRLNEDKGSTIMMVTHDAFAASFCRRILFIKDGRLSHELHREQQTRKQFFQQILASVGSMGGEMDDII